MISNSFLVVLTLAAAWFLEQWKRRQMCLRHTWDLTSLEDEEVIKYSLGNVLCTCKQSWDCSFIVSEKNV